MYKIEIIFKEDKTERRFPLEEQSNERVDAIRALIAKEKEEISKAFIVNQDKEKGFNMTKKVNCSKHGEYIAESLAKAGDKIIWTKCSECIKEQLAGSRKGLDLYEGLMSLREEIKRLDTKISKEIADYEIK